MYNSTSSRTTTSYPTGDGTGTLSSMSWTNSPRRDDQDSTEKTDGTEALQSVCTERELGPWHPKRVKLEPDSDARVLHLQNDLGLDSESDDSTNTIDYPHCLPATLPCAEEVLQVRHRRLREWEDRDPRWDRYLEDLSSKWGTMPIYAATIVFGSCFTGAE